MDKGKRQLDKGDEGDGQVEAERIRNGGEYRLPIMKPLGVPILLHSEKPLRREYSYSAENYSRNPPIVSYEGIMINAMKQ